MNIWQPLIERIERIEGSTWFSRNSTGLTLRRGKQWEEEPKPLSFALDSRFFRGVRIDAWEGSRAIRIITMALTFIRASLLSIVGVDLRRYLTTIGGRIISARASAVLASESDNRPLFAYYIYNAYNAIRSLYLQGANNLSELDMKFVSPWLRE
jgi:hypothetical protein